MGIIEATVPWSHSASATPLGDLCHAQIVARTVFPSIDFGRDAIVIMNRNTMESFLGNANALDLYGRRTQGQVWNQMNIVCINQFLHADDLPSIEVDCDVANGLAIIFGHHRSRLKTFGIGTNKSAELSFRPAVMFLKTE